MHNSPDTDARLQQFMKAHTPGLVLMLRHFLSSSTNPSEFVGLVLGAREVDGVHLPESLSLVPRDEVCLEISREDARIIPAGQPDALPVFVQDRGVSHAFLFPITNALRRSLGLRIPGNAVAQNPLRSA